MTLPLRRVHPIVAIRAVQSNQAGVSTLWSSPLPQLGISVVPEPVGARPTQHRTATP